mgnify:CR=1 FL=1
MCSSDLFVLLALVGGALFLARLILQFIGFGGHGDAADAPHDIPHDVGPGSDYSETHSGESAASFKLLTFQGIMAFLLIFGLAGIALRRASGLENGVAVPLAALAGLAVRYLQARLMVSFLALQSTGNRVLSSAVVKQGTVYLTVPAEGTGQVQLVLQGALQVLEASSGAGETLKTGERVVVTGLGPGGSLVVARAAEKGE